MRKRRLMRQRLIDRGEHPGERQLVETLAVTLKMSRAAELLAGQARQWILHHPYMVAPLPVGGRLPHRRKPADPPRSDPVWACRAIQCHGRTSGSRREVG